MDAAPAQVRPSERADGLDPRLDVFLDGSTEVNANRAVQCGSIALAAPDPAAAPDRAAAVPGVDRMTPSEVRDEREHRATSDEPPEVRFSVFLRLRTDLGDDERAAFEAVLDEAADRWRIKGDAAMAEVPAAAVVGLAALPAVSYVEAGERLSVPQPLRRPGAAAEAGDDRRVEVEADLHRDGEGVLVGIIDVQGFDFAHPDFLDEAGHTRWVSIWDQAGTHRPPPAERGPAFAGLTYGAEIRAEHMAAALAAAAERKASATILEPQSTMARASHGTHVASIAAGNRGVARRAHLAGVLVSVDPDAPDVSFYDSTRLVGAVDHLLALAAELGRGRGDGRPLPVSINISLGTNGHAHDASSGVARWVDHALTAPGRAVCVAAGNAGQTEPATAADRGHLLGRIHAGGALAATNLRQDLTWLVGADGIADVSENEMEIWYSPQDRIAVELRLPDGTWIEPVEPGQKILNRALPDGTYLSIHNRRYHRSNGANFISIHLSPYFGPVGERRLVGPLTSGRWTVRLHGRMVRDGRYDAWIGRDDPQRVGGTREQQQWAYPSTFAPGSYTEDRMIGSLACAERVLAVGNADVAADAVHVSSSRGPTRDGRPKPDIAAPGTAVTAAGGFDRARPWVQQTGTSMASPYVCGVAALMLAIDPSLTAAQIQGLVKTTSIPFPGHQFSWRPDSGFGVVDPGACVADVVAQRGGEKELVP